MKIGIVACCSKKADHTAYAKDLYQSTLFKKSREYVENNCEYWLIVSAKYGLIYPGNVYAPYDLSLNDMTAAERRSWSAKVERQIGLFIDSLHKLKRGVTFVVLAGKNYRTPFAKYDTVVPLEGLGIGKQLQRLTQLNKAAPIIQGARERIAELKHKPAALEIGLTSQLRNNENGWLETESMNSEYLEQETGLSITFIRSKEFLFNVEDWINYTLTANHRYVHFNGGKKLHVNQLVLFFNHLHWKHQKIIIEGGSYNNQGYFDDWGYDDPNTGKRQLMINLCQDFLGEVCAELWTKYQRAQIAGAKLEAVKKIDFNDYNRTNIGV